MFRCEAAAGIVLRTLYDPGQYEGRSTRSGPRRPPYWGRRRSQGRLAGRSAAPGRRALPRRTVAERPRQTVRCPARRSSTTCAFSASPGGRRGLFAYDTAELVRLYRSGLTCREISRQTGADRSTVEDHLHRAGVHVVQQPNKATDEQRRRADEMWLAGHSSWVIADEVGVSQPTVMRWCGDIERTPPPDQPMSPRQAAAKLGTTKEVVLAAIDDGRLVARDENPKRRTVASDLVASGRSCEMTLTSLRRLFRGAGIPVAGGSGSRLRASAAALTR